MAAGHSVGPSFEKHDQTTIRDIDGNPVLIIGTREYTIIEPDGTQHLRLGDTIQLVDGLSWSPSMMAGANPILLTTCSMCRNPSVSFFGSERASHGCLSVRNARVCVGCGIVTCPRHRSLSGGKWRCLSCARWNGLKRLVKPIFFSRHEEV